MKLTFSSITLLTILHITSAGPIHRENNVIRHANSPAKRYVANNLHSQSYHRRQEAEGTVSNVDPFAVPTKAGSEDGGVPAVGVGGSINTSLLSLLTDASVTSEAAAFTSQPAVDSNIATQVQASDVVTDAAASTTDAAELVTTVAAQATPAEGQGSESIVTIAQVTPTEGQTSESIVTIAPTATAVGSNAGDEGDSADSGVPSIAPITNLEPGSSTTIDVDGGAEQQVTSTVEATTTLQTTVATIAADPAAATPEDANTVVTDQSGSTLALASDPATTVIAAAESTPPPEDPNTATPEAVTTPQESSQAPEEPQDASTTDAPAEVTIVFVTASPTFTGPTAGFVTIDSNGNVVGSTSTPAVPDPAPSSEVPADPTTEPATAAPSTSTTEASGTTTTTVVVASSSAAAPAPPSDTPGADDSGLSVIPVTPGNAAAATNAALLPVDAPPTATVTPAAEPQAVEATPTAADPAGAAAAETPAPGAPSPAENDPAANPATTDTPVPIPSGLILGQVISGESETVTVTETVSVTVTAGV